MRVKPALSLKDISDCARAVRLTARRRARSRQRGVPTENSIPGRRTGRGGGLARQDDNRQCGSRMVIRQVEAHRAQIIRA